MLTIAWQVALIYALDIVNTACDAAYIYEALVIHFGTSTSWQLGYGLFTSQLII